MDLPARKLRNHSIYQLIDTIHGFLRNTLAGMLARVVWNRVLECFITIFVLADTILISLELVADFDPPGLWVRLEEEAKFSVVDYGAVLELSQLVVGNLDVAEGPALGPEMRR